MLEGHARITINHGPTEWKKIPCMPYELYPGSILMVRDEDYYFAEGPAKLIVDVEDQEGVGDQEGGTSRIVDLP